MNWNFLVFALVLMVWSKVSAADPSWVHPDLASQTPGKILEEAPQYNPKAWAPGTEVQKIEDGVITFMGQEGQALPPPLRTNIHDAQYLGKLIAEKDPRPFLLLSGLPCKNCEDRRFLYLVRSDGSSSEKLLYPGQVKDRDNGTVLHESRAFFGRCLPDRSDVFVSVQSERIRRMRYLQPATFIAEAREQLLEKETIVRWRTAQRLRQAILQRAGRKSDPQCFEIKGYDRKTLSINAQKQQENPSN